MKRSPNPSVFCDGASLRQNRRECLQCGKWSTMVLCSDACNEAYLADLERTAALGEIRDNVGRVE